MSPRRNWDSPNLSLVSECAPPPPWGVHPPAGEGLGESQFRRLEKKLSTLPTLCSNLSKLFYITFIKKGGDFNDREKGIVQLSPVPVRSLKASLLTTLLMRPNPKKNIVSGTLYRS